MIHFTRKVTFSIGLIFLCTWLNVVFAQDRIQVSGRVLDAQDQKPLSGVTITQKGTSNAVSSNGEGRFQISVPSGTGLLFSFVGYESKEFTANQATLTVQLTPASNVLEDVVVIGYGTVKRKDVTTAVSSVSTKDLEKRPVANLGQAIQGKAAGVSVIQPSGEPGADMSIRVRGTTSFNSSNAPLYVVDGLPVEDIRFLSPNDIADIQILKDASSAAIYGSRAANGVILVTTKSGKAGEAKITLGAQMTANVVNNTVNVLNTQQYKNLMDDIGIVKLPLDLNDQTDWFKETYKTGIQQNYQLSISDGNEKLRYYLGGGYLNEKGTLEGSFFRRYNFRANIDNQVRKWLKVNANINYSDYNRNGILSGQGSNRGGVVTSVINTPTYAPIWDPLHPNQYYNKFYGVNITSPLDNLGRTKNNNNRENRLLATGSALFTFSPELTLKSSFSIDRRNGILTTFLDPILTTQGRNQIGEASDLRNTNTVLTWDNVLNYTKQIGKHRFEGMLGSSWTDSKYSNSYIYGSNYANDIVQTLNAANKISWDRTGSGASNWAIMSYFARAMYNYDGKYLVTANMRADGSSKLSPAGRWGYFPSVSAAWRVSAEDFMKDVDWINDFKIRGGWGQTGNQSGLGDYAYLSFAEIQRIQWFVTGQDQSVPNINVSKTLRAKDLTWETTTQANVGIDFTALQSRLTFTADYYHKKTKNLLVDAKIPDGQKANSIKRNGGEMTNKGFEFGVNSKNLIGEFQWNTDFNISFNKNRLDKLDLQKIYYDAVTNNTVNETVVRNEPGRSLGGFFGYISDGVDPETGELMYRDLNGDGRISSSDRTYIGNPNPKFVYGLTNSFSWKNFDLSIFIQGTYGNDIFNASRMETEGMYDGRNQTTVVLDRWQVPGQITHVPKAGFDIKNSTYFVEDGSYLRVKNISLGYAIGTEKLKRIGIQKIQPYFSVSNLLTLTKYSGMDPEVNQWGDNGGVQGIDWGTYPQNRSFVLGVNLEF
ncbi:MAG: TonB-dependent receptor [Sphingobacterium sp.]|jgi:TonB-linked SusC/RagA family outer membrane protein|nr:TonB-dependent receptor [Sphingobacterium sp.]